MTKQDNSKVDEGLQGNEKIEEAILGLQKESTQEMLAHTLTIIRRRMKEKGQVILAVEPPKGLEQISNPGGSDIGRTELVDGIYKF